MEIITCISHGYHIPIFSNLIDIISLLLIIPWIAIPFSINRANSLIIVNILLQSCFISYCKYQLHFHSILIHSTLYLTRKSCLVTSCQELHSAINLVKSFILKYILSINLIELIIN